MHLSGNARPRSSPLLGMRDRRRRVSCRRCSPGRGCGALRDAQRTLVGGGRKDLVEFAVSLQGRIDDLHRAVDEVAARPRAGRPAGRRHRSRTPRSSATTPTRTRAATSRPRSRFLDAARTGVVITAIQGRDYARIYMKELDRGKPAVALSPEEQQAVERAMGR